MTPRAELAKLIIKRMMTEAGEYTEKANRAMMMGKDPVASMTASSMAMLLSSQALLVCESELTKEEFDHLCEFTSKLRLPMLDMPREL